MDSIPFHRNFPLTAALSKVSIPVTRLAWSKEEAFLAALALWQDSAYVTVWDMQHIPDPFNPPSEMANFHRHCAVAVAKLGRGVFDNLSIGLAISPKGDMIAIYQEPKIGEWSDGSGLEGSDFEFCLFDNPARQYTAVSIHNSANEASPMPRVRRSRGTHDSIPTIDQHNPNQLSRNINIPNRLLNFIGYGAFVTGMDSSDWEMDDVMTAAPASPRVESLLDRNDHNDETTLFIACTGIYIDIYKIKPGQWEHSHSVRLTDLTPTLSRRITCKMMMEAVSSNTFLWLEDRGLGCTIWDLQKGSYITHLSISDSARLGSPVFLGNSKVAISPDESVTVLASADGILTTFYTTTGIMIGERKFPDHQIEHVAFNGQSHQLFVIVRKNITLELSSWILDHLQPNFGTQANQVPVPIIGKSILAYFRHKKFENSGLVCESDGSKIQIYVTHNPVDHEVEKNDKNRVSFRETIYPPLDNGQKAGNEGVFEISELGDEQEVQEQVHGESSMTIHSELLEDVCYELSSKTERALFLDGNGSMYWVHRVEIVKK
ncbi:hypothetical protein BGX34_005605, partial [Mortierella sp. NVP85]